MAYFRHIGPIGARWGARDAEKKGSPAEVVAWTQDPEAQEPEPRRASRLDRNMGETPSPK